MVLVLRKRNNATPLPWRDICLPKSQKF